jgi:F0F1-type ATP synthase membrane subunit b/b'
MSPALANFLFEAANFVVLAGALVWLSFKPLRKALNAERERHASEEQRIAQLREEAESHTAEIREAHEGLEQQLAQEREDMLEVARNEAARIEQQARAAADEQQRAFERNQSAMLRAQSEQLAETLGRVVAASLRRLLDSLDGPALDLALVRGACASLTKLSPGAEGSVVVETARSLDAAARELLRECIGAEFEDRLAPELGAGVRVTTSAGQVDATAVGLARHAAREVVAVATEAYGAQEGAQEERGGRDAAG